MEEKDISFSGSKIFYRLYGKGQAVVLIHGFPETGEIWARQIDLLQQKYLLIVPDLPGSGKSEMLHNKSAGMEDYAACIHEILHAENISSAIIIGHSMGGYIALAFAEKYPSIVKGLGLIHSTAYADDEEKIETRQKAINIMKEKGSAFFLKTAVPAMFFDAEKHQAEKEEILKTGKQFKVEALIEYYKAMIARKNRTEILKAARYPILFVIGKNDKAIPLMQSLEQTHLPNETYIKILRESAHMGMIEEADSVNKVLGEFLQDTAG